MNKTLSQRFFIISMCLIFSISLGYLVTIYFILNPQTPKENLITSLPVTKEPVSLSLTVSSPNDNSLVFNENILISGKASSGSVVILSSEDDDVVITSSKDGNFSLTYKLSPGTNDFTIGAFDATGNNKKEERTVYYSKDKI